MFRRNFNDNKEINYTNKIRLSNNTIPQKDHFKNENDIKTNPGRGDFISKTDPKRYDILLKTQRRRDELTYSSGRRHYDFGDFLRKKRNEDEETVCSSGRRNKIFGDFLQNVNDTMFSDILRYNGLSLYIPISIYGVHFKKIEEVIIMIKKIKIKTIREQYDIGATQTRGGE